MDDYRPNSNRYKEEQKDKIRERKVEKVVTGKVITKKPSAVRKLADEFISEDAKNVKSYVFGEVLIPAIKKAISDIVTDGIDIILYGESRKSKRRSTADRFSYSSCYDDRDTSRRYTSRTRSVRSYDDIIIPSRGEAEDVLDRMYETLDTYKLVRVADLYDLVGISCDPIDNNYGWTSLNNVDIVRVRTDDGYGYMIKLPRAVPID